MKKRILSLILCVAISLSLAACNTGRDLPLESQVQLGEEESEGSAQIISCGGGDTEIVDGGYDAEEARRAAMNFAVNLFQQNLIYQMEEKQSLDNTLVSPLSVYLALGMLENGAKGETLAQLEQALGMNVGQMNCYVKAYLEQLTEEVRIANSIWFTDHQRFTINNDFVYVNETYYGAELYKAPFDKTTVKEINDWVENRTEGMIKDILDEIPADAVMYLINALVFKADWADTYDKSEVRKGVFHIDGYEGCEKQNVDMMYSEEGYYLEDEHATGFIKYYEDRKYAFATLLPNEDVDVYTYAKSLTGEKLLALLDMPVEVHVNAAMPAFVTEYQVEMKDILKQMGIVDAFDGDKADFSGLGTSAAGNVFADRVIHKTFIEVSPVGTKAGAATVIEMRDECVAIYDDSKEVILDRPFIYMIIDCETNQPIFMGTVNHVETQK